jgi:Zn-dependent peptidase ImmA (M78 family)
MSGLKRIVPPLRRADIALRADTMREQWRLINGTDLDAFPVTHYIENILIPVFPDFDLEIVEDDEMPGIEGATWPDQRRMRFPNSVYEGAALRNEHRARFTVAHELGHLMLHSGIPFARAIQTNAEVKAFEDSEWQADEFAGALLMPLPLIATMGTIEEIVTRCQVSQQAAECRLRKLKMNKPHGW